jgi:tetratricopeptide (TPR) repeat protein
MTLRATGCALLLAASVLCGTAAAAQRAESVPAARVAEVVAQARTGPLADAAFTRALALGGQLIGEGRYAEAAELFLALAEKRPRGEFFALYGAALATFNAGRAAEAESLARRAAESALASPPEADASLFGARRVLNVGAADALVLLAVVLAVRGDDAGALAEARRAVAVGPANFDAQFTLGRALYGANDHAGAAQAFRAALALRPDDPRSRFFLATALERAGDLDAALGAYRELAARHPRAAEGHLGLGVLLVKRGGAGLEEGIEALKRAVALDPKGYEAQVTLGRALVTRGRAAEAVEHLKRAAELAPNNPEPHYQLSLAYRRLGRRDEAARESAIVKRIHEARRVAAPNSTAGPAGQTTPPPDE